MASPGLTTGAHDYIPILTELGIELYSNEGVPTASGPAKGALVVDITNGQLYINAGTVASATWNSLGAVTPSEIALASGDYLIGNGSGVAAAVTMSGDVSQTNTGVTTVDSINMESATITNIADGEVFVGDGAGVGNFVSISGDATMDNTGDHVASAEMKTDLVTVGLMGTVAAFGFPFNVTVDTAQAAAFAKIDDGGSFANLADSAGEGGYTGAFQCWPDTELENDAVYFGAAAPFGVLTIDVSATAAVYSANSVEWEYYNGSAFVALTIIWDNTDSTNEDGQRPFQVDGQIIFSAPTDWTSTTVDTQAAFWVRARIKAGFNVTTIPLLVDEHKLVTSPTASEMPAAGTIGRSRVSFITISGANNDTQVILCNLTKGTASDETTLTQALLANEVANWNVPCDAGDQIVMYITTEDGTTEFANGIMEMVVVKD